MIPNFKKLAIEDIYLQEIQLTDTEAQSINGGSPTLPLPPPSSRFSLFSLDWVAIQPQPLPPGVFWDQRQKGYPPRYVQIGTRCKVL